MFKLRDCVRSDISATVSGGRTPGRLVPFTIVGHHMNQLYPPGALVLVKPVADLGRAWTPQNGQRVVVERQGILGQREAMVREILIDGDDVFLCPRSDHPNCQTPIRVHLVKQPGPDESVEDDSDSFEIVGLVVRSIVEEPGV